MIYDAPLDAVLRVREQSPMVRILQHARQLEIAREQGNIDAAMHQFNLMMRLYHEHFKTPATVDEAMAGERGADRLFYWPYR